MEETMHGLIHKDEDDPGDDKWTESLEPVLFLEKLSYSACRQFSIERYRIFLNVPRFQSLHTFCSNEHF
jgi:hypothetical protein